jgi:hypothetical protein
VCVITIYIYASINNISSIKEFSFPLIVGLAKWWIFINLYSKSFMDAMEEKAYEKKNKGTQSIDFKKPPVKKPGAFAFYKKFW